MITSIVHLAVVEAERRRDLQRRQLVRAAMATRQATPARRPALPSFLQRWFGKRLHVSSRAAGTGTTVAACC